LDELPRAFIFAAGEFSQRDFLACPHLIYKVEIRGSQYAEVLAILLVNALNVLRDDELNSRRPLGVRRLLPAGTFSTPFAADTRHEPTILYVAALNRQLVAALQAGVGKFTQGLVKEEADVRGRDLVRGNIVAQLRV